MTITDCQDINSLKISRREYWWPPICLVEAWILNESTSYLTMTCQRILIPTYTGYVLGIIHCQSVGICS